MNDLIMIQSCVKAIREKTDFIPEVGLILGSGLGDYAERIENKVIIPYKELPGFPVSTVAGHVGQFVLGEINGRRVIAMQGRVHYYEGYTQRQITMPVRIMKCLGVDKIIITNAAGGVNRAFNPGTLMMIRDHINFSGSNPLIGKNPDEFGARFPDMTNVYSKKYQKQLKELVLKEGINLEEGVYMMLSGPSYETPAEVRMAGILGADAVGMSTVPEAIVCAQMGISVLGISCITNCAAGILDQSLNHAEVVETANRVKAEFVKVIDIALEKVVF